MIVSQRALAKGHKTMFKRSSPASSKEKEEAEEKRQKRPHGNTFVLKLSATILEICVDILTICLMRSSDNRHKRKEQYNYGECFCLLLF